MHRSKETLGGLAEGLGGALGGELLVETDGFEVVGRIPITPSDEIYYKDYVELLYYFRRGG